MLTSPHNFVHDAISFFIACMPAAALFGVFAGSALQERRRRTHTGAAALHTQSVPTIARRSQTQDRRAA